MPNWTSNIIRVEGPEAALREFLNHFKGDDEPSTSTSSRCRKPSKFSWTDEDQGHITHSMRTRIGEPAEQGMLMWLVEGGQ